MKDDVDDLPVDAVSIARKFFYDGGKYYLDTGSEFVPMDQRSVSRHVKRWGFGKDEMEEALCRIQVDGFVSYAGPLAGHHRGLHEASGAKILATSSPKILKAKTGNWSTLRAVIDGLLGDDQEAGSLQVEVFLAWLKFARESLESGKRRPGQALALTGPRGSGKSLLIDIIELSLGGRRANPYPYFSGRTSFNGDLAGAELLAVDDEAGNTNIAARRNLASAIKSSLFSGAVRIEGKHRNGFTFRPCWRMVLALNDEPEALLVLPPLTEDIADKITLMRCHRRPLPMPAHTLEEREAFFAQLKVEIPAMLAALNSWKIPETLQEDRCGVRHFHHPEIERQLGELSPEGQLLSLVDSIADIDDIELPWTGTASDLKGRLTSHPTTSKDAERLLGNWQPAVGVYLSRLEGQRVEKLRLRDGIQNWRILPRLSGEVETDYTLIYGKEKMGGNNP